MAHALRDLRHALRTLAKSPGFTAVTVLTLALGIGANVAIFTVVWGVLLEPLPYAQPDRLMYVMEANPGAGFPRFSTSPPNYADFRDQNHTFEALAAITGGSYNLTGEGEAERLRGARVSWNYFQVMGVAPVLGRVLGAEDDRPEAGKVVVLSDGLWQRRFGGDRGILGRTIRLNGEEHTVVGVMPASFATSRDLYVPLAMNFAEAHRGAHYFGVLGRLKDGVTVDDARADLKAIAARLEQDYPDSNTGWTALVYPYKDLIVEDVDDALEILMAAVGVVLLIACANVASLLMARMAWREREVALRTALGAGRGHLLVQFLTESVVLALVGGALGTALAYWGTQALMAIHPDAVPRAQNVALSTPVLLFAVGVSVAASLVFGLLPAIQASRPNLVETLKEGSHGQAGGRRKNRVRTVLVAAEVALALTLLVGAGLLIRSFGRLLDVDPGFRSESALTVQLSLPDGKYGEEAQRRVFYRQLLDAMKGVPGVASAGTVMPMPLTGDDFVLTFNVAGRPKPPPNEEPNSNIRFVSAGYLEAMAIPLLRGRTITEQDADDAPRVALLSESAADKLWPGEDPLGQRITFDDPEDEDVEWWTLVGIVGDVRHEGLNFQPAPEIYLPVLQSTTDDVTLVARTSVPPESVAGALRAAIRSIDPELPLYHLRTLNDVVESSIAEPRFNMSLLALFAGLALTLAAIGIYGLISYSVTQRQREVGVRMALGADRAHVLGLMIRQGMLPVVLGLGAGLALAFYASRFFASLVYGVATWDLVTFLSVPAILGSIALAACSVPALRATRVDPVVVLRDE